MLGLERRQEIMQRLRVNRKVYVSELAKAFKVTEETIRRDLEKLEAQDLLQRSYGGAVLLEHTSEEVPFVKRSSLNNASKARIAETAENLIQDGDTIMVDSSTTCEILLQRLRGLQRHITIITNSIHLMEEFASQATPFTVVCTGGVIRQFSYALTGAMATDCLKQYYVDYALISCKALDLEKGIMESNESESRIKRLMIEHAEKAILLADHTKFNRTAFVHCADICDVSCIVTDTNPGDTWKNALFENDVQLLY